MAEKKRSTLALVFLIIFFVAGVFCYIKFDIKGEKESLARLNESRDNLTSTYNDVSHNTPALRRILGGMYEASSDSLSGIAAAAEKDIQKKTVIVIACFGAAAVSGVVYLASGKKKEKDLSNIE